MEQRLTYWHAALELVRATGGTNWFGEGPGSFPRLYLAGNQEGRVPANFTLVQVPEENHLRIGAGDSFYLNQRVDLPRVDGYRVEMRARADGPAAVAIFVCEKYATLSDCAAGVSSLLRVMNGAICAGHSVAGFRVQAVRRCSVV